jgi:hypothetical protein
MMNKKTRKLSFVNEVWAEIEPHVLNCDSIINKDKRKLLQLDLDKADYVRAGIAVSVLNFESEAYNFNVFAYFLWQSLLSYFKLSSIFTPYRCAQPLWNDLDVNQHVNHVKYISWILEVYPFACLFYLLLAFLCHIFLKLMCCTNLCVLLLVQNSCNNLIVMLHYNFNLRFLLMRIEKKKRSLRTSLIMTLSSSTQINNSGHMIAHSFAKLQ